MKHWRIHLLFLISSILTPITAICLEDITAFTQAGKEVVLKKNGTWSYKDKKKDTEKIVKIGVIDLKQSGDFCIVKYEVNNNTPGNFKNFWPNAHLVDKKGYRFGSKNVHFAIRPGQKATSEAIYSNINCSEVAKVEIDSFHSCVLYEKNKEQEYSSCENMLAPLVGTKIPVIIIKEK